ncbi:uncharacterized protein CCOS01_09279 [Colletotrichum costaricense]|uniref:Uncharacterized protein n=1 Tax=Colletotrichum costaricense TaxID=1209916 RepID=A0AAI9YUG6_9PEZI|nr:uncharacterized protein CCOS01_09279 [Colletotrichum costaricense]KAK1524192.1 hypothetical protein CCOS01_09279 [Colletotrichum costaricense]
MKRAEFRQTDQIPSYSPQESTLSTSPTTTTSMSDVALHIVFAAGFFDSTGPFPVHSKELLPRGESFLGMTWSDGQAVSNFHRTPALNSTQQPDLPWSTTLPQQDKNNLGAPLPDDGAVSGRELPAARLNSRSSSGRSPSSKT